MVKSFLKGFGFRGEQSDDRNLKTVSTTETILKFFRPVPAAAKPFFEIPFHNGRERIGVFSGGATRRV